MPLFISSPGCASGPDIVETTPTLISVCAAATPMPTSDAPSSARMKRDMLCMLNASRSTKAPPSEATSYWNDYKGVSRDGQASWPSDRRERGHSNHWVKPPDRSTDRDQW